MRIGIRIRIPLFLGLLDPDPDPLGRYGGFDEKRRVVEAVLRIGIRIRIPLFLSHLDPDPDPLGRGMDPDQDPAPDPSFIKQK